MKPLQLRLRGASEDPGEMSVVEEAYPSTIPFVPPVTERTIAPTAARDVSVSVRLSSTSASTPESLPL